MKKIILTALALGLPCFGFALPTTITVNGITETHDANNDWTDGTFYEFGYWASPNVHTIFDSPDMGITWTAQTVYPGSGLPPEIYNSSFDGTTFSGWNRQIGAHGPTVPPTIDYGDWQPGSFGVSEFNALDADGTLNPPPPDPTPAPPDPTPAPTEPPPGEGGPTPPTLFLDELNSSASAALTTTQAVVGAVLVGAIGLALCLAIHGKIASGVKRL